MTGEEMDGLLNLIDLAGSERLAKSGELVGRAVGLRLMLVS